jgi:O-methyltransferase
VNEQRAGGTRKKRPRRAVDAVSLAPTVGGDVLEGKALRELARRVVRLAVLVDQHDRELLRATFRRAGLVVEERDPDRHYVHKYFGHNAEKLISGLDDATFMGFAREVRDARRTFLYYNRLFTLYQAVGNVARRFADRPIAMLEAGVHRGGSAFFLGRVAAHAISGPVVITAVDTFSGHAAEDIPTGQEGVHTPGTFGGVDVADVRDYLEPLPTVEVIQGRIQDVADVGSLPDELHLIHCDLDLRLPTQFVLELAAERLPPGGIVVVDDYGFTTCPGVRRAVDEFAGTSGRDFVVHRLDTGQALFVRTSAIARGPR